MDDQSTSGAGMDDLSARLEHLASGADGAPDPEAVGTPPARAAVAGTSDAARAPAEKDPPKDGQKKRRLRPDSILLPVGFLVACAGVAFAIGRVTAPAGVYDTATIVDTSGSGTAGATGSSGMPAGMVPPGMDASAGTAFAGGPPGAGGGSPSIAGTVSAVANGELTITLADGTVRTIATSPDTGYHTESAATDGDVAVGMTVSVSLDASSGSASDPASAAASDVTILDE